MNKIVIGAAAFCLIGTTAAFGAAGLGAGVAGSPHDLSQGPYTGNDTQGRICAYCHTPHHAAISTDPSAYLPLWSKDVSLDTKTFYTAYDSVTVNAAELKDDTKDKAIGPTRLCMSCHDGVVAPDQHYGVDGSLARITGDVFSYSDSNRVGVGAGVGAGDAGIANDHPVGFDYNAVAIGPTTGAPTTSDVTGATTVQDPWIRNPDASFINNSLNLKIADRLYVSGNKAYMTCATCHDVHNRKNLYTVSETQTLNYLVLSPQTGSALCLTCHIK